MLDKNATPRPGVIIVCAGKTGLEAFDFFGEENVICFADNSPAKWNTELRGKRICSPNEIRQIIADSDRPCDIVIGLPQCSFVLRSILRQLYDMGHEELYVFGDMQMCWKSGVDFLDRDRTACRVNGSTLMSYHFEEVNRFIIRNMAMQKKDMHEERWRDIRQRYKRIYLQKISIDAVGELLPRYFAACEENKDPEALYVLLPVYEYEIDRDANERIMRYTGVCDLDDCLFWRYVMYEHPEDVDISEMDKYVRRYPVLFPTYYCKANSVAPHFTEEEIEIGEKNMREMGINGRFACINTRNDQYNKVAMPAFREYKYAYRNSDFMDLKKTIDCLSTLGISTVKMGRFESPIQEIPNCVDYAGRHSNDFMDLYLFSKCEFAVTGSSGIVALPMLFSKPLLMINAVSQTHGNEGMRYTEHDLMMYKKYYNKRTKKYMTIDEVCRFEIANKTAICSSFYSQEHIELHNNTEDEILEAVQELIARIDGKWVDTDEDIANYNRYYELMHKRYAFRNSDLRDAVDVCHPMRPAATFLRKYKFMLD